MNKTNKDIETVKDIIVKNYHPDRVILFGSYARGNATEKSDIDILVISDQEKDLPRFKRGLDVRVKLSVVKKPKDILFYTHDDITRFENVKNSFVNNVLSEGTVLYG